ncbi:MAG: hypothetical protein H0T56_04710 [Pseudaminobacter sp.]|nr:hypothetical protein [Pseudaminobacter sp.]
MRVFFLILFIAGFGLAGYPWVSANFLQRPVGTWRVYDAVTGFLPAHTRLTEDDAPLRVIVDMTTTGTHDLASGQAILTLTANTGAQTVLAEALSFADATPRDTNPQTQEKILRDSAGVINAVPPGDYVFTLGPGDAQGVPIRHVDLILRTEAPAFDQRLQPAGFGLLAIGFIGFVLSMRGPKTEPNPNSQPPRPRWGRGGGQGG